MRHKMSSGSRKELLGAVRQQYLEAGWKEKQKLLDGFVAATGYSRKYALTRLNKGWQQTAAKRERRKAYDDSVREALMQVWQAANRICSKRLIPFMPTLVDSLEKFGHLVLPEETRHKLLNLSAATVDRLLQHERKKGKGGVVQIYRVSPGWSPITPADAGMTVKRKGIPHPIMLYTTIRVYFFHCPSNHTPK